MGHYESARSRLPHPALPNGAWDGTRRRLRCKMAYTVGRISEEEVVLVGTPAYLELNFIPKNF